MAVFYHVSTNLSHNGEFVPRVPSCRHQDAEDDQTLRVSVSPTIEGCLSAIPNGGAYLEDYNLDRRGYYLVFRIDTEKLGIPRERIVTSTELYERDLVRDADITDEHWITTAFAVPKEDSFMIRLLDWDEVPEDVLPHFIFQVAEEKYNGDYMLAFREECKAFVPSCAKIENARYQEERLPANKEIPLLVDSDSEKEELLQHLRSCYDLASVEETNCLITVRFKKDINLRNLFLFHATLYDEDFSK
jgi:hypothetical protein